MWDSIDPWQPGCAKAIRNTTPRGRHRRHGFGTLERGEALSANGAAIGHAGAREPKAIVQDITVPDSVSSSDALSYLVGEEKTLPTADSLAPAAPASANDSHRQSGGESHRRSNTFSEFEEMAMELFAAIDGAFGSL